MSNPKFSVGDLVAVCAMLPLHGPQVVIPKTTVTSMFLIRRGAHLTHQLASGHWTWPYADQWVYYCAGLEFPTRECNLRPILPGEYTEDTQDIHKPVEVDA